MVPLDSMPMDFMVASQVPSSFLSVSCSGPGLGKSWARTGTVRVAAITTAQNQHTICITPLHKKRAAGCRGATPPAASRRVRLPCPPDEWEPRISTADEENCLGSAGLVKGLYFGASG